MYIFKIIFVIIGTLVGAGFATGQEVNTFFLCYGVNGIYGIFISSILIGIIIYKVFKIIEEYGVKNYEEFINLFIKNQSINKIVNIILNTFILISFYVMIAGFGAYLNQKYNINMLIGSAILAILCYFTLKKDVKGLIKINELLMPILILIILIIRCDWLKHGRNEGNKS